MSEALYDYQMEAVEQLRNGNILCGGVGSGKSRTALAYYLKVCKALKMPLKLYVITTARKRDTKEWEVDMAPFSLCTDDVVIDSWNNIQKYRQVTDSFFIFDEQRVIGYGAWTKAFLTISRHNQWILLSATPGDTWLDYIPVFIANGFYRNKTDFIEKHVIYSRFSKFPKVDKYVNTGRLIRLRNNILVNMNFDRKTEQHHIDITVEYDPIQYKKIMRERWDVFKDEPLQNAADLCYALRRSVNSNGDRIATVMAMVMERHTAIIFYNFDYELDMLKKACQAMDITVAEWNGHKHQEVPYGDEWAYLVQYTAGSEGWNCIRTDTIIFYSQNYSYKTMVQAAGRIDRLNTPYKDLYFYHIKSRAGIDIAISRALSNKKKFNETKFVEGSGHRG